MSSKNAKVYKCLSIIHVLTFVHMYILFEFLYNSISYENILFFTLQS